MASLLAKLEYEDGDKNNRSAGCADRQKCARCFSELVLFVHSYRGFLELAESIDDLCCQISRKVIKMAILLDYLG